jgi:hypothetical protein
MTQRLQSFQPSARKDAAYTLGRLGDQRAVPSLVHVLKYDLHKDVRIASAIALGEIGGSDAAIALERCTVYEKRDDVRKAATTAIERLNAKAKASPPPSPGFAAQPANPYLPPPAGASSPFSGTRAPSGPAPEPPAEAAPALGDSSALQPPPPPTPVPAGPGGTANR